jgi:membrane protein DedA with SNARE-associated domain
MQLMSEPVNPTETTSPERSHRLADGVALGLLGGYLLFRTVTNRIGLGIGPRLLDSRPWVIPLLNNSALLLIQAGTGTAGRPGMLIATGLASVFMSTVAGLVIYWAGWRFGHRIAELAAKPGSPWAGVWNPKQIARAERWMDSWGVLVVFFGRVIEYFTLPVMLVAGASGMRLRRFLFAHTLGAIGFAGLFLWIGGVAQNRWPWLKDWISDVYGPWALRISLVLIVVVVALMLIGRRQQDKGQDSTTTPSQDPSDNSPPTG